MKSLGSYKTHTVELSEEDVFHLMQIVKAVDVEKLKRDDKTTLSNFIELLSLLTQ